MDEAFDSGTNFVSGFGEMGPEQKQKVNNSGVVRGEVDTSAPFESVMQAVTRFGGRKPHTRKPLEASEADIEEVFGAAKVEEQATDLPNDLVRKERGTLEFLKEIEATETTVEELEVKPQKEVSHGRNDDGGSKRILNEEATVQMDETELCEILKRVEEVIKEVKSCTRVLEKALSRVESARRNPTKLSCRSNSQLCGADGTCSAGNVLMLRPTMSIGQILSRKLVLAEEHFEKSSMGWKVSLAQILSNAGTGEKRGSGRGDEKGIPTKRMKFAFGGMSFLVAKLSTKMKTNKQGI